MAITIGVDIGGTKIAVGAVDEDGTILERLREPTPSTSGTDIALKVAEMVTALSSYDPKAIGIGAAGFISADRDTITFGPNNPWKGEKVASIVTEKTGLPAAVENDANVAAWGEYRFGAAAGAKSTVVVTLGTGVGGGVILDGDLIRGNNGFAGEIGHITLLPDGPVCGCGRHGCWDVLGSGHALVRFASERAVTDPSAACRVLELSGVDPDSLPGGESTSTLQQPGSLIKGEAITAAAKEGDPLALGAFRDLAFWNIKGISTLIGIVDPEVVVLAGGVAEAGNLVLDPVVEGLPQDVPNTAYRKLPDIRVATLGNNAGLVGAADLARTDLL